MPGMLMPRMWLPSVIVMLTPVAVDFERDVRPIIEASCVECHAYGVAKGGFSLETRESMLANDEAVKPGDAEGSLLVELIRGDDPDWVMPVKGDRLTTIQVDTIMQWIDEGAAWPEGFAFRHAEAAPRSIKPRRPAVPDADGLPHPIDRILHAYYDEHEVEPAPLVDDAMFLRRVSLDLVGLLPPPDRVDAFVADANPDKRPTLVETLLADEVAYAEHWLTFWNDLLRNDYSGTGYIDGGRRQITTWLYGALHDNMRYDRFVASLINPTRETEGFANGIRWRGESNASQTPEMQFAQNVSQVFLGENMKCASCHDSFIDGWKLADTYGLAAITATEPLELYECDKATGETAHAAFPFPEIGDVDATADREVRLEQLAGLMTSPDNGRLTRTIVNRLWARLCGRGLVEPVDVMSGAPWSRDLLDFLAADLADHDYDIRHTLELIATSRAYQRHSVAVDPNAPPDTFLFRGPTPKRLTAEQLVDAAWMLTGGGPKTPRAAVPGPDPTARWIWNDPGAGAGRPAGETVTFRRLFELTELPTDPAVAITCDNEYTLNVNGDEIARDGDWPSVEVIDIGPALRIGANEIVIVGRNHGSSDNPAGLFVESSFVRTDGSWECRPDETSGWIAASVLDNQRFLGNRARQAIAAALARRDSGFVRASLVNADALMRTLGRPNREQVVTGRPDQLTTLQALVLTNGPTVTGMVTRGVERLGDMNGDLVDHVFLQLLTRRPTASERQLAAEMPVDDFLWAMLMHPEFQLIE
jgi:hypothetical protein